MQILLSVSISDCSGPFVEVIKIKQAEARKLHEDVIIYNKSALTGISFKKIIQIKATSCQNLLWEPHASQEDALNQLRYKASRVNANGIINLYCEADDEISYELNCWTNVTCQGLAIQTDLRNN